MPELPDVEIRRRYLDATSLHDRIRGVDLRSPRLLRDSAMDGRSLTRALQGHALVETRRHGKYLFARLDAHGWLVLHLGMTGDLRSFEHPAAEPTHTRMLLTFESGSHLAFQDQRTLGRIDLAEDIAWFVGRRGLGPDALDIERSTFDEATRGRRAAVKPLLLNQSVIAGIGNLYADEVCFQAELWPETPFDRLDAHGRSRLLRAIRHVLRTAVDRHADPDRFPRTWLLPHRREGAACPRGDGEVERIEVAGRGTYGCRSCQRGHR
ncbi:MAG TPA: DNA-formamidopyrimidine glycosylase family protein [Actinomycetota bacterium]|jgi:formamidopyrimidine-DNA glycosylase|nr:DNA-formamidopyrimidine glycosylase family protein [Actinomycetota bacterium]